MGPFGRVRASRIERAFLACACAWIAGCCGSQWRERQPPRLAPATKALDSVHERLARTGGGRLHAGAAVVDVTPELPLFLGGFEAGRLSQGVRDPVFARALYLDDGQSPFVLVTIDVIGLQNDDVRECRELASDRWRDRILVASTHDHAGPDTIGLWGRTLAGVVPLCTGRIPEYMDDLRRKVALAVDAAALAARPARIRVAATRVEPVLSENVHEEIASQKDDLLRVLVVEGEDGAPIAGVANWGCHAEALGNDDHVSADWPGAFYRRWEREVGGVGIFAAGALGGLVAPNFRANLRGPLPEPGRTIEDYRIENQSITERLALMEAIGGAIADAAAAAARGAEALGPDGVTLSVATGRVKLEMDNWRFEYVDRKRLAPRSSKRSGGRTFVETDVVALRIRAEGRVVADLASVPGEPTPPVVEDLDATSDAPAKFNVALGNDEIGYILREAEFDRDAYEYERTLSLGSRTATRLVEAIRELRKGL
jgi:hypothetical protein